MSTEEKSTYKVDVVLTGKGSVYVLARSEAEAQAYVEKLSAGDFHESVDLDYELDTEEAVPDEGEEWTFDATEAGLEEDDDDDAEQGDDEDDDE